MLDRILYPLRRRTPELGRLRGSWKLSIVLMVVAAFYYGLLAVWAALSPPDVVRRIASLVPFWSVYALLLINTGLCLWRRLPSLRRDLRAEPAVVRTPPSSQIVTAAELDHQTAKETLTDLGFRYVSEFEGGVWGMRRRWAALGTFLFHGSFFLVMAGAALTLLARDEDRIWVAVGEEYVASPDQILGQSRPGAIWIHQPPPRFVVESISPEFWGDVLLFTRLEASLVFPDGQRAVTRINRPLWRGWWTFLRLSGFGYAPRYELTNRSGSVRESSFVKMTVFPPGQRDFFSPEGFPHRIDVEVLPDAVLENGKLVNRSFSLTTPAVKVLVSRGRMLLGEAVLREGESLEFEGLQLSFPEIEYWGEFAIVRDPGAPVLFLTFAVALAGLLLKIGGGRAEALWTPGGDGRPGTIRLWGPAVHLPESTDDSGAES
jgi:hypothetical protein